tara:strand:+ start:92 stop:649 length:558 start_codon:yes stop_codon:yes gene_type:complete
LKKFLHLIIPNLFLFFSTSYIYASENYLFGIKFYGRANDFFSYNLINSAAKEIETLKESGFSTFWTDNVPIKNTQFKEYGIVIDSSNTIHKIKGYADMPNFQYCSRQSAKWSKMLEKRFNKASQFNEFSSGEINVSAYSIYPKGNDYISARCNSYSNGKVRLWVYWESGFYKGAITEYYESLEKF